MFRHAKSDCGTPAVIHRLVGERAGVTLDSSTRPLTRLPWDFHPALTEERLRFCARLLANARRDAVALAAREMGDGTTGPPGCRAYAFGTSG